MQPVAEQSKFPALVSIVCWQFVGNSRALLCALCRYVPRDISPTNMRKCLQSSHYTHFIGVLMKS